MFCFFWRAFSDHSGETSGGLRGWILKEMSAWQDALIFPPHIYMFNAISIANDISCQLLSEWLLCAAHIAHWIVHVT